jgi:hypothetical protein
LSQVPDVGPVSGVADKVCIPLSSCHTAAGSEKGGRESDACIMTALSASERPPVCGSPVRSPVSFSPPSPQGAATLPR